jgi:methylated-DNA-[protein]-cysteine S-methyltransferase
MSTDPNSTALERALRGFAPDLRPPVLPEPDVAYAVEDTAVGRILLATAADGRVVASAFAPDAGAEDAVLTRLAARVSPRVLRDGPRTDEVRRQLEEYLSGRRRVFDLHVDLALAGSFQRDVLTRLAAGTGYGERTTYGALAAAVGRPRAARAVGAALGANPLCVVLPCHRVVASSGALTGYAGGMEAKRLLLDLESAPTPSGQSGACARR